MTPLVFLISLLALTAAAAAAQQFILQFERKKLRRLARAWHMHYAPADRLRLAARVAEQFALPGVYDVRVRDLMFRTTGARHEYLFTIEYGTGVVRGKRRRTRVGAFAEPVARGAGCPVSLGRLVLAPNELEIEQQYSTLFESMNTPGPSEPGAGG